MTECAQLQGPYWSADGVKRASFVPRATKSHAREKPTVNGRIRVGSCEGTAGGAEKIGLENYRNVGVVQKSWVGRFAAGEPGPAITRVVR